MEVKRFLSNLNLLIEEIKNLENGEIPKSRLIAVEEKLSRKTFKSKNLGEKSWFF